MSSALNDIASPQAAVGYFVDTKKGEVNELKLVSKYLLFVIIHNVHIYNCQYYLPY